MPRFNFQNKKTDGGDGSNRLNNGETAYEPEVEEYAPDGRELYNETLKELWFLIICCIVGWVVAVVGFCMNFNMLLVLLGVLIVDIPAFRIILAGGGLGALFGSAFAVTTVYHYSDGSKREDNSGQYAGLAVFIFTMIVTLVVGLVSIVIRIFKAFFSLLSIKKEYNLTDVQTPFIPVGLGIGVFIVGLIVSSIVDGALDEYLPAPVYESELTNEEEVVLVEDIRDYAYSHSFGYTMRHDGEWLFEVKYNGSMRRYTITVYEEATAIFGIAAGEYVGEVDLVNGSIGFNVDTPEEAGILAGFTLEKMISFDTILGDLDNLSVVKANDAETNLWYYGDTAYGADHTRIRILTGTGNKLNLIVNPMWNFTEYGINEIDSIEVWWS